MVMMLMNVSGGIAPGEMMIFSGGRRTGKSTLNQYYGTLFNHNLCNEILLPMKSEPKYKFSRSNWYVAEFDVKDYTDVVHWCTKQFGSHPRQPDAWSRWVHNYENKIHFRDSKDYEWFVLKWS
jgi:hypothetical protein